MAGKQGGAADGDDDGGAWPTTLRSLLYISSSTSSSLTDGPPVCLVCCVVFPVLEKKLIKQQEPNPCTDCPFAELKPSITTLYNNLYAFGFPLDMQLLKEADLIASTIDISDDLKAFE